VINYRKFSSLNVDRVPTYLWCAAMKTKKIWCSTKSQDLPPLIKLFSRAWNQRLSPSKDKISHFSKNSWILL